MKNEKELYAVIGHPVEHSLSPIMQNAGFLEAGINAEYIKLDIPKENIKSFVELAKNKLNGFNITVPNKSEIIPYLNEIDDIPLISKSVNTVSVRDKELIGTSTDGYGLEMALKETFGINVKDSSILFIGCGGVVKALSFYFASQGIKRIFLVNRTLSTAKDLFDSLNKHFINLECFYDSIYNEKSIQEYIKNSSVIIQCTSLGLKESDMCPINPKFLLKDSIVFDTIYRKTKLLEYCENNNILCSNGLDMLLYQGAKSFSIWTGIEAPIEAMRKALYTEYYKKSSL